MRVLGVDPGATGALVVLSIEDGQSPAIVAIEDMPTGKVKIGGRQKSRVVPPLLSQVLWENLPLDYAYVEEVGPLPKQGVTSTFAFGQAYGLVLGTLAALKVPTETLKPQRWRPLAGVRGGKDASRMRACQIWPLWAEHFKRVKDDGRAEAGLIAYAGFSLTHHGR